MEDPIVIALGKRHFVTSVAEPKDVEPLRSYIVSLIGEVTPLDQMHRLTLRNPDWLNGVLEKDKATGYVGAFTILPLGEEASEAFNRNAMVGSQITVEHLAADKASTKSIYVGSVLSSKNPFYRAATLVSWKSKMATYWFQNPMPIYTRPTTPEGQRTALSLGYRPVTDAPHALGGMIYRCDPR
ncbi:MAG TPA: hypothetical protein VIN59_08055 [Alphaproteobacteria bacterium]